MKTLPNSPALRGYTITREKDTLQIGRDFVDAVTGKAASHGGCTVQGKTLTWTSTLDQRESYRALRQLAEREGKVWGDFWSQAAN